MVSTTTPSRDGARWSTSWSATARSAVTHCTDDGVGLVYRGTELVEAVTETPGKGAYVVRRVDGDVVEERLEPRRLPPPP